MDINGFYTNLKDTIFVYEKTSVAQNSIKLLQKNCKDSLSAVSVTPSKQRLPM